MRERYERQRAGNDDGTNSGDETRLRDTIIPMSMGRHPISLSAIDLHPLLDHVCELRMHDE